MHPENRKVRNLVAEKKGIKRVEKSISYPVEKDARVRAIAWHSRRHRNTTKLCSRVCCGNPRKYFGAKTKQECKSDTDFEQQLEEEEERDSGM